MKNEYDTSNKCSIIGIIFCSISLLFNIYQMFSEKKIIKPICLILLMSCLIYINIRTRKYNKKMQIRKAMMKDNMYISLSKTLKQLYCKK